MESIWTRTTLPVHPPLEGRHRCDAVVLGGGMAGILTAWFLRQHGLSVIVLEANRVGSGQTQNTTAKITAQHGLIYERLIDQLGAAHTPCIRVFNKCDAYLGILPHGDDIVCISARSGEGADALVSKLLEMLDRGKKQVKLEIPYSDAGIVDLLKREAAVLSMEYTDTGITAEAIVTPDVLGRVKKYIPGYVKPKEDWE